MSPAVEKIGEGTCDWAMTDRAGYGYPHGIPARYRVEHAAEFFNGTFCKKHTGMAVVRSIEEAVWEASAI